jgi:hypothetical protein
MEFEPGGGPGGSFFRSSCPAGAFMVGLKGRHGDVIDNMHVFCAFVSPIPAIPPRKNWTRDPNNATGAFQVGNFIGLSGGGGPDEQLCNPPHLVKTIRFNTRFFDGLHLVAWVNMDCTHDRFVSHDVTFAFDVPPGSSPITQSCPRGMWAVGLKGRFGDRVDAIGLLCAPMP